jgi:hypothetical protein
MFSETTAESRFDSKYWQEIFIISTASTPVLWRTQPRIKCIPVALSLWEERPKPESGHILLSGAEVKNNGAIPPLPIRLKYRINFIIKIIAIYPEKKRVNRPNTRWKQSQLLHFQRGGSYSKMC